MMKIFKVGKTEKEVNEVPITRIRNSEPYPRYYSELLAT